MKVKFYQTINTNMQIGNDFLVFKYLVTCKKNYKILIIFIEININICLFMLTT